MKWLFRMFFKATGWLPGLLVWRPKIYQENRSKHTNRVKGKAIIIANHKNLSDFFIIYLVFFWKRVRTLASELLYRHRFIAFLSNMLGNILVHRERSDLSWMGECEKRLAKGDAVCIFPEGRFVHEKEMDTFKPACVYLALRTNTPIVPVYISHNGPKTRKRVNIGEPIDLSKYCNKKIPTPDEAKMLCEMLRAKVKELGHQIDLYEKYHVWNTFSAHHFIFDTIRISGWLNRWIAFPTKYHYEEGASKKLDRRFKGRGIVASKHSGLTDAPLLTIDYLTRRTRIIVSDDAWDKVKLVKHLGTVKYTRTKGLFDPKMMLEVRNILKCNGLVGIYPEGRMCENEIGEFSPGLAYFALSTNTPIYINIPLHQYKPFKRNHVMIGKRIVPSEIFTEEEMKDKESVAKLTEIVHTKFVELYEQLKTYEKHKK